MENLKRFTAEQARDLKCFGATRTVYERVMNSIYTGIRQTCRTYSSYTVNLSQYNATLVEKVIKTLLDDGYKVEFDYMTGVVTVKW